MPNRWRSEPKVTYKMERTRSRSRSRSGSGSSSEGGSTPSSAGRNSSRGAGANGINKSRQSVGSANGSTQKRKEPFENGHNSDVEATEQDRSGSGASTMGGHASTVRGKERASSIGSSSSEDFASPSPARTGKKAATNRASSSVKMSGTKASGKKRSASPGRSTSPRKQIVSRKSIGVGVPVQSKANDGPMDQQKSTCTPGGKSLGFAFDAASASVSTSGAKSAAGPANDGVGNSSSVTSSGGSASTKRKRGGTPSSAAAASTAVKKTFDSTSTADGDINANNEQTNVQTTNAKKARKSRKSLSCEDDYLSSSSDEAEREDKSNSIGRDTYSDQKKGAISIGGNPGNAGEADADDDVIEIIDDDSSASGRDAEEEKRESQSSSQSVTGYDIEEEEKPTTSDLQAPIGNLDGMEIDKEEEEEKKEDVADTETSPTTPTRKASAVREPSLALLDESIDGSPMNVGGDEEMKDDVEEKDRPIDPEAVICWACSIPLQRKGAADKTPIGVVEDTDENGWGEKAKTLGLYSIHAHPLLQISVCSACADKAYDIEDEALQCVAARAHGGDNGAEDDDGTDPTEMEACSLCAIEATQDGDCPLFLCCDACPRTFCARCVAILNGGGSEGRKYVEDQTNNEDEDAEWSCPACEAPDAMDRMQVAFVGWSDEGATVEADRQLTGVDKEGSGSDPSSPETKTTAALIEELNYAEDGLFEAEKKLEYDSIAKEREVVVAEVRKDRSDLSTTDIEKEVDAEMEGWIQQWQDHHSRLSEAVTTLQDALVVRGIDLAAFYKDREANVLTGSEQGSSANDVPSYVRDADAALDKRDEEEGFGKGEFRGSSGYKMDMNIANLDVEDLAQSDINEIEDINTLEGTLAQLEHISRRNDAKDRPCRWSKTDLTEGDISNMRKRALRRDDEDLARLNIDVAKLEQTGIKEDADAAKEKEALRKETTRRTAGGVRINLLALSTVKKKKKAERQSAKKAKKRERERANGPRYGVAFSGVHRNISADRGIVQPVRERLASEVNRREAKWAAAAAAQGGKATKRRIAPQTIATEPGSSINRNLFSSSSAFASLVTTDRYGDAPKRSQTPTMPFEESNLSLPSGMKDDGSTVSVSVVKPLASILKTHQVDGVKFMWENTCSDLLSTAGAEVDGSESPGQIKGAILAHNMGLGKSVQLCTYLHTFLAHPSIINSKKRLPQSSTPSGATSWHGTSTDPSSSTSILRSLQENTKRRALLCVPVNTIANWENEWSKWILTKEKGKQVPQVPMYNLNSHGRSGRLAVLAEWMKEGGVLLTSDRILAGLCKPLIPPLQKKSSTKSKSKKAKSAEESGTDNDTDTGATTEASNRSTTSQMSEMERELIKAALLEPGPDVVCLDEGHQMLKNSSTNISRALHLMKGCPRRIVLTGTPIQNNLKEAYRMAKWTNPSCRLGTEADFTRNFSDPIMDGMKKDATAQELFAHDNAMKQLHEILDSFVQRRGADVLANDLPPMQQCVINIRQSKLQQKLYRQFGRYKKQPGVRNNFFDQYQKLRPVNNHPATLLIPGRDDKRNNQSTSPVPESLDLSRDPSPKPQASEDGAEGNKDNDLTPTKSNSNSTKPKAVEEEPSAPKQANDGVDDEIIELDDFTDDDAPPDASVSVAAGAPLGRKNSGVEDEDEEEEEKWWKPVHDKTGDDDFMDIREGGKIVLLLQILTHADTLGDKVVCFTQCLKTIDYIERVLNSPDWGKKIPAIETLGAAEGRTWGQWRRNREYLRIDGATSASDRGDLVTSFNQSHDSSSSKALENQAKLFLISKEAGGIGINLYAANRVILFDSHWNPSVDLQAIYRCYRYGQTKSVFAYRFLTEGTMEDKIYSRSVNKSGLAARVIDQKHPERAFTGAELDDILQTNTMVCCDLCDRWRVIPPWAEVGPDEFEGFWCCEMNKYDKPRAKCEARERDQAWYQNYFQKELARRQKKEQAKLERQKQREELALSQQSHDILGSQSQELTLYDSEMMRESMDDRPRVDPNKGRNTSRDLILRRLLYTAGGSSSSHQTSSKKGQKKHVTSWISKYHFHESLLQDDKNEAQNSKDAAAVVAADAAAKAAVDAAADDHPMDVAASSVAANSSGKPPSSKMKGKSQSSNSSDGNGEGAQMEITNSPPPSPDTTASSKKKADDRSVPIKSETGTAITKKRSKIDPSDESASNGANNFSTKKPRLSSSGKKKSGEEVHIITLHENGHDVLEILDSDEEEQTEKVAEKKTVGNSNQTANDYGDNNDADDDGDDDDDDEGVDGVLV